MPRPTTSKPVMAPPRKAESSAGLSPPRAASAVRTLARTEMIIPMKPVAPERTAPMMKPIAACQPMPKPINTASTAATIAMVVYWRLRERHRALLNGRRDGRHRFVPGRLPQHPRDEESAV